MYLAFYVEKKTINLREKPYMGGALSTLEKEAEVKNWWRNNSEKKGCSVYCA